MGYYLITDEPPPITRASIEYLMRRAGERFVSEFPASCGNILMELDADARTVRAWVGEDTRTYSFDALV